jgi:hypothetical protein
MLAKLLSAGLLFLAAGNAVAASDETFALALTPGVEMAANNRYKLVEKKAEQRLELHKALRDYSNEVKKSATNLRNAMHDTYYEDWINTKLLPLIFEAEAARDLIDKTVSMERDNVKLDLKAAKAGNYDPIDVTMTRMAAFEAANEAKVKAIDANVAGVRKQYEHHYGLAKEALAQFNGIPLVRELLAANPVLVKHTKLAPASMRPLVWRIELIKEKKEYNDPRYGQLPKSISVLDGTETVTYQIIVR